MDIAVLIRKKIHESKYVNGDCKRRNKVLKKCNKVVERSRQN